MKTLRRSPEVSVALHSLKVDAATPVNRLHMLLYSLAIVALIYHRSTSLTTSPLLFLAELQLAFMWATSQSFRWRPVGRREFPDRLIEAVGEQNLPGLDVFICTADPEKEPPINVVNTSLSAMAFDYPPDRISLYVSDDGGSELTLFAFMEAAKFARHWLPFCREKRMLQRSPEAYFASDEGGESDKMKKMYETMKEKVEDVVESGYVSESLLDNEEERELFKKWKGYTRRDHPSIIKVLLDSNKDRDIMGNAMPNLVYVSREKSGTVPHNFKAGALNTLLRVSSIMSNAPVLLTLDCDMYSTDPKSPYRALCYMMDPAMASRVSFVHFPQRFQGLNKNDIYAGELKHLFTINARGLDGLRGPNYLGTCCFHSRQSFHGPPSSPLPTLHSDSLRKRMNSEAKLKEAQEVASCTYEHGTKWGSMIGFRYGSLVEDYLTGYGQHCEGWISVFCNPGGGLSFHGPPSSPLVIGIIRVETKMESLDNMFVQLFLSGFGVVNCWPVYEAMFWRRDGGRMPTRVTKLSILLASVMYLVRCMKDVMIFGLVNIGPRHVRTTCICDTTLQIILFINILKRTKHV